MRNKLKYQIAGFAGLSLFVAISFFGTRSSANSGTNASTKIFAQKLVEDTLAAHPEIAGVELATTPPNKTQCVTIASNDAKEIGEKCDKDEFKTMKTGEPFVEKENEDGKQVYDVTLALHDAQRKVIGTVGMDFKPEPNQQKDKVVERAQQILKELEGRIKSKEQLFEPAEAK
jgi:iron complex outermembrane receptor protein